MPWDLLQLEKSPNGSVGINIFDVDATLPGGAALNARSKINGSVGINNFFHKCFMEYYHAAILSCRVPLAKFVLSFSEQSKKGLAIGFS